MKRVYRVVYETNEGPSEYDTYSRIERADDAVTEIIVANRGRRDAGDPVYITKVKILTVEITENVICEVVTNI